MKTVTVGRERTRRMEICCKGRMRRSLKMRENNEEVLRQVNKLADSEKLNMVFIKEVRTRVLENFRKYREQETHR